MCLPDVINNDHHSSYKKVKPKEPLKYPPPSPYTYTHFTKDSNREKVVCFYDITCKMILYVIGNMHLFVLNCYISIQFCWNYLQWFSILLVLSTRLLGLKRKLAKSEISKSLCLLHSIIAFFFISEWKNVCLWRNFLLVKSDRSSEVKAFDNGKEQNCVMF